MGSSNNTEELMGVAIIGMSCRFPGANDVDTYWQNLLLGLESISFLSDAELRESHVIPELVENPNYVKACAVLDDIEGFDASFFGFSPSEASLTDPQHRIFLECAWEALERAGYTPESHGGSIAVYGGAAMNGYLLFNLATRPDKVPSLFDFQVQIGNDKDYLTTRVSYKLNLKGPSINVQTACSTSLTAVHMACQSLLNGECNLALAGGVSIGVPHRVGYLYQEAGLNSKDGHCRVFDEQATGTVLGSGVGIVVLKRLADAISDGDHIHAVIKGSAVNNDGNAKVGYTAPGISGQAAVIVEALAISGLDAGSISYVETHGTGTQMGDPIEIKALTQAFSETTDKKGYCALGSVKSNIGHMDVASGIAGLIKTALMLEYGKIPATLNFNSPNPEIEFKNSPFFVNVALADWKHDTRRAGVSSFGLGGTNVHVVLEQPPLSKSSHSMRSWYVLPLSAKTPGALDKMGERLAAHMENYPQQNIADVAFTLQAGREPFSHRRIFVCQDRESLLEGLGNPGLGRVFTAQCYSRERSIVFMFPGQGSQYVGMGRDLYAAEPCFKAQLDLCAELFRPHIHVDLRDFIFPLEDQEAKASELLQQTWLTQAALFTIEYSLAQLWMEWGVRPKAMIGHSIGEYVALCLAGVMSLQDAVKVVATRGRLMQGLPGGAMLAVDLPSLLPEDLTAQGLSIAAENAPSNYVLSGTEEAVGIMENRLAEQGVRCRRLSTSHAFHSYMMDPILDSLNKLLDGIDLHPPRIPVISNLTGTWLKPEEATDPSYYTQHLRKAVQFSAGIRELLLGADRLLLEVGPGRTLCSMAQQSFLPENAVAILGSMRHSQQEERDEAALLTTLGKLWLSGVKIDWAGFYSHEKRYKLPLPSYPFEHQRYWIEPRRQAQVNRPSTRPSREKNSVAEWFYIPTWKADPAPLLPSPASVGKLWLVFAEAGELGMRVARHLEKLNHNVVTVISGSRADWIEKQCYMLNPGQQADYGKLVQALAEMGKQPHYVIHAWNVGPDFGIEPDIESFERYQDLGFNSLVFLAQALGERNYSDPIRISVLSSGLHAVTGEEMLCSERATMLSACIVASQEYTNLDCRNIDLIPAEPDSIEEGELIIAVLNEIEADTPEAIVAYRGTSRWLQDYIPVNLERVDSTPTRLRDRGVYVITGGLGSIGLLLAEFLVLNVRARLVLIGRSALPNRGEWEQWLADHDITDAISIKIHKVRLLEDMGAEVLVISADVADWDQMQSAIKQVDAHFGHIDGVIHGAGIIEEKAFHAIQCISKADCECHFRPKIHGLLILDGLLKGREPDFYMLLSSISAIVGGLGYAAYAAANLYLDAYAKKNSIKSPGRWVSVNWDAWQFAKKMAERPGLGAIVSELAISPEEGFETFRLLFSNEFDERIIVSTTDLSVRIEQWVNRQSRMADASSQLDLALTSSEVAISELELTYDTEMQQIVASIWCSVLGVKHISIQDNFFDLGGNSLMLIDVIGQLKSTHGLVLNPREIMFQTLGQVAAVCDEKQAVKVSKQSQERPGGLFHAIKRKIGLDI